MPHFDISDFTAPVKTNVSDYPLAKIVPLFYVTLNECFSTGVRQHKGVYRGIFLVRRQVFKCTKKHVKTKK